MVNDLLAIGDAPSTRRKFVLNGIMGLAACLLMSRSGYAGPVSSSALLINARQMAAIRIPIWDDRSGTVLIEDRQGNKRAASWNGSGYIVVSNGKVIRKHNYL